MPTRQQRAEAAAKTLQTTGSLLKAAGAFVFPSTMQHSGRGGWLSIAPRNFPYQNTDPLSNSAVVNTLAWITRNFGQAELSVYRQKRNGTEEPIVNHPLQQLLERPNAFYGGHQFWAGLLLSYFLDGNAYAIKERNARGFGVPTALWYEPHWTICPVWPNDGSQFLSHYERRVNGTIQKLPVENVIHLRNGLNPANTRYGLSPLKAALLEVFTDTEASLWIAALCRNMAIPGVIVSPTELIGMTPEKGEQIKETWKRKFGGDNRGEPLILDFNASVTTLGFDPKQMEFKAIHDHAESRIAGALGVPPQLTYLNVANESSSYNNLTTFERIGWEQCLIPAYESLEDTLDAQLLPDFESDPLANGYFVEFDTSDVRPLKDDADKKEARANAGLKAGALLVDEYREQCGLPPLPNGAGQILLIPNNARPATPDNLASRAAQEISDPAPSSGEPPNAGQEPKQLLPVFSDSKLWPGPGRFKTATVLYPPGTRVQVDGEPHMEGQTVGTVAFVVEGNSYAVVFDGQEGMGPHKWYFEDELELEGAEETELVEGEMGLPRLQTKSVQWEGLTLRREPTDLEKLCLKAIDDAMRNGQVTLDSFLSDLRQRWFAELAAEYDSGELDDPTDLQDAVPTIEDRDLTGLLALLTNLAGEGAALIVTELNQQGASLSGVLGGVSMPVLATLASATITKLLNDVRARAVASAIAAVQLGLPIADKIRTDAADGSTGYVSRAAGEATNLALARGRDAEIAARSGEIQFLVYSAVLDSGTCQPCGDVDGRTGDTTKDLPSVPNPACDGGAQCRCVLIPVRKTE